jgi:hypothetical protein
VWTLTGFIVSVLVAGGPHVLNFRRWRRNIAIAVMACCVGALPLLIYNIHNAGITFRANAGFNPSLMPQKVAAVRATINGSGLFGWLVNDSPSASASRRSQADGWILQISDMTGRHRTTLLWNVLICALVLVPFVFRYQPAVYSVLIITPVITFFVMASTPGAGTSVHHTMLLWPWPLLIVLAVSYDVTKLLRLPSPIIMSGIAVLLASQLLVLTEYHAQFIRGGPGTGWTDALARAASVLPRPGSRSVVLVDWNLYSYLVVQRGDPSELIIAYDVLRMAEPDPVQVAAFCTLARSAPVYVGYTRDREMFPGVYDNLLRIARRCGYNKRMLQVVSSSRGDAVIEIFELVY